MGDRRNILVIMILMLLLYSCATVNETYDPNDLSYLYNPLRNNFHPYYRIYNTDDESSELSIKFFSNDLFFSEANSEGVPKAQLVGVYKLYNMSQGRVAVDTGMFNITIRKESGLRTYFYSTPLKAASGSKYEVELLIRDVIRKTSIQAHIPFDKTSRLNRYNFKVYGHFDRTEIFNPVLQESQYINLEYPSAPVDTIFIKYYKPFLDNPFPPSLLLPEQQVNTKPDQIVVIPYSDTLPLMFPKRGLYHATLDTTQEEGYTFFNFGADFPGMRNPLPMIEPLVYLSSDEEIAEMMSNPYPKLALDDFWLNIAGNVDKSRELIRIYYNRVMYANLYFTSYREGWRTDRGMIYIIYGPPDKVYKTMEEEKWGYKKTDVKNGWGMRYKVEDSYVYFTFRKRDNIFTENDYTLIRSENLTTYWDVAIRSWKSGIVFRLDNPLDF